MQVVDSISSRLGRAPGTSPLSSTLRRVQLGDHFLSVRQWPGSGPPLILVHGISSSGSTWESLLPALGEHYSPITFDLRGHGESGRPTRGFLFDDYVNDLDGVVNALGIDRPLLMGHSFGGLVTLGWAAKHLDRALGLVIVDTPLRIGRDLVPAFRGWMMLNAMPTPALTAWYRAGNRQWGLQQAHRRAKTMKRTARGVFVELRDDAIANDGIDRLADAAAITSPILLVRGDPESGSFVRRGDLDAFGTQIPHGRVIRIPGAGHALHRERTAEFAAATLPFLQECVERHRRRLWVGF
jgi:pimeloyl-ACP methyl ester carboxylesterase